MKKDIWFIDDDEFFRLLVEKMATNLGYQNRIDIFSDGDRALIDIMSRINEHDAIPSLIFLDLNMKNLDGWQLIDLLNEINGLSVKIVIVSSSDRPQDSERASQERLVVDRLVKPITSNQLEELVATHTS